MNRHMVEEAGSRFFEMASSLGKIHANTLSGMADAAARTPLGPVFAINASLARMAHEGMETMTARLGTTPVTAKAAPAPSPAKPKAAKKKAAKAKVTLAPAPVVEDAPFAVDTTPATAIADAFEPDVADVLVDDVMVEGVLADVVPAPEATIAPALTTDNLSLITGIGATTAKKLNGAGVESFAQIAAMKEADFAALLETLDIKSIRFSPALWIAEAQKLSS